jgi:hypothetical protein
VSTAGDTLTTRLSPEIYAEGKQIRKTNFNKSRIAALSIHKARGHGMNISLLYRRIVG